MVIVNGFMAYLKYDFILEQDIEYIVVKMGISLLCCLSGEIRAVNQKI